MDLIEQLLRLVAPQRCLICTKEGSLLCGDCRGGLPRVPPRCYLCNAVAPQYKTCRTCRGQTALYQVFPATLYDDTAKALVHCLKFARAKAASSDIAQVMAERIPTIPRGCIVTHVPTAPARVRERGYDQAELIARAFALECRLPYCRLLARTGSARQVGQGRLVRRQQLANALRVVSADKVSERRILIIDDVLTTGSTCQVAAQVLHAAGAKRVMAAVFAVA